MALIECPKCNRKRRFIETKEKTKKGFIWVKKCYKCLTPLGMEDEEDTSFEISS